MTREEIMAIRATGLALVAQCDAVLARVGAPGVSPYRVVGSEASGSTDVADPCLHPTVVSTAVSGFPGRAKCTACGTTVERVLA